MDSCMFCLDETTPEFTVITLDFNKYMVCECKIHTHVECWMTYILHKGHIECPICHTIVQTVVNVRPPSPREIQVRYSTQTPQVEVVQYNQLYRHPVPAVVIEREPRTDCSQKIKESSCIFIILFILMIIILSVIRR